MLSCGDILGEAIALITREQMISERVCFSGRQEFAGLSEQQFAGALMGEFFTRGHHLIGVRRVRRSIG